MLLWTSVHKALCGHCSDFSLVLKELLGHQITLPLTFEGAAKVFSKVAMSCVERPKSTSMPPWILSDFSVFAFFYYSYLICREVLNFYGSVLHFVVDKFIDCANGLAQRLTVLSAQAQRPELHPGNA